MAKVYERFVRMVYPLVYFDTANKILLCIHIQYLLQPVQILVVSGLIGYL
jgi:hypothetical protein